MVRVKVGALDARAALGELALLEHLVLHRLRVRLHVRAVTLTVSCVLLFVFVFVCVWRNVHM